MCMRRTDLLDRLSSDALSEKIVIMLSRCHE